MNYMQKGVIALIKSAVTEEPQPLPEDFSIDEAYDFIMKHKIIMLAYDGAVRCGIPKDDPAMQKLFQSYIKGMLHSEKQMKAVNEIYSAFNENDIDYLPLKGCNMKFLYPKPELRSMGDADILIKEEQYGKIKTIFRKLGYKEQPGNGYHYEWKSPDLFVEAHSKMMSLDIKRFSEYYENCWDKAFRTNGNRFSFSREDEFIFAFVHFTKHYMGSGIGLRHIMDIYVYLRSFEEMDFGYIEAEFEKLGIKDFYKNVKGVIDFCFCGGEKNSKTEVVLEYILKCGNWGTEKNAVINENVKNVLKGKKAKKSKFGRYIETVFIPLDKMQDKFKVLRKFPFLLPFCWIAKWGEVLALRSYRVPQKLKAVKEMKNDEIEKNDSLFEISGINVF